MSNTIRILRTGYSLKMPDGLIRADCTITLITGTQNVLVDTGGCWRASQLTEELSAAGISPEEIHTVICTHGHSDHVGCLALFPNADMIVGFDIFQSDVYTPHDFRSGLELNIAEGITVKPTPGHTTEDISVFVETNDGLIAIAGDLFENKDDLDDESIWLAHSTIPELQRLNRSKVLEAATAVIPGHGDMFILRSKK